MGGVSTKGIKENNEKKKNCDKERIRKTRNGEDGHRVRMANGGRKAESGPTMICGVL